MHDQPSHRSTCTTCHAPVIWAITPAGARIPLDAGTVPAHMPAAYSTVMVDGKLRAIPAAPMLDKPGTRYHQSHFSTCPDAAVHSRKATR